MGYALSLSPLAERQLAAQPEPLRSFTVDALARLALSPAALSKPSAAVSRGQVAEFAFRPDPFAAAVWLTVTFLYGSGEQTLHVEHLATEFGG